MLCDTCRRYPRHIEEFEGMREISLSLSCPEAARIILSQTDPVAFRTFEKETAEETYDDFDYFLFSALMDTRDYLLAVLQDRSVPVRDRVAKLLVCTHDFQLAVAKQELFSWETIRARHERSGFSSAFLEKIFDRCFLDVDRTDLMKQIWKTVVPKLEVLSPSWTGFLRPRTGSCCLRFRRLSRNGRCRKNSCWCTGCTRIFAGRCTMNGSLPRERWRCSALFLSRNWYLGCLWKDKKRWHSKIWSLSATGSPGNWNIRIRI